MRNLLYIGLLMATYLLSAQEVTLGLSPRDSQPGDIVRLTAEMRSDSFGRMELKGALPKELHLIGREQEPIHYDSTIGQYSQSETWVLQSRNSGEIELTNFHAAIEDANGSRSVKLSDLSLNVQPYPNLEDTDSPEHLHQQDKPEPTSDHLSMWYVVLAVIAIAVPLIFMRWQLKRTPATKSEPVNLESILNTLQTGEVPHKAIEALLVKSDEPCSLELRLKLEQVLYSKDGDCEAALVAIRKELSK